MCFGDKSIINITIVGCSIYMIFYDRLILFCTDYAVVLIIFYQLYIFVYGRG